MSHIQADPGRTSLPRRHISQACDACKKKKTKCDGSKPCGRCNLAELNCQYSGEDRRLLKRASRARDNAFLSPPTTHTSRECPDSASSRLENVVPEDESSSHCLADRIGDTTQEDHGDTSTYAFLRRISGQINLMGKTLPRNILTEEDDLDDRPDSPLVLPERSRALEYLNCFFDHLNGTYRYLSRRTMLSLLEKIYSDDNETLNDHASVGLFLAVAGSGCLWTASWKTCSVVEHKTKAFKLLAAAKPRLRKAAGRFPPSITVIQAHFAFCSALVASHKYNSAWMMLGTTIRLGQIIGLGKEAPGLDPLEHFARRGLFWAMFVMDRYLSIMLGRPFGVSDTHITVPLPESMSSTMDTELGSEESRLIPGTCAHIKLMKIASRIMNELYGASRQQAVSEEQTVAEIEDQIAEWLKETPKFFHPPQEGSAVHDESTFYSIPWLLKRQRNTVQGGLYFVQMLLYRGFLLKDFMSCIPHNISSLPLRRPRILSQKCIQAALAMADLADQFAQDETYNAVFWATSHLIFCSVATLCVSMLLYEDNTGIEATIERAMRSHSKLTNGDKSMQHVMLEESRSLAKSFTGETGIFASNRIAKAVTTANTGQATNQQSNIWPTTSVPSINNVGSTSHNAGIPELSEVSQTSLSGPIGAQGNIVSQSLHLDMIEDSDGDGFIKESAGNIFDLGSSLLMDIGFDSFEFNNSTISDM